MFLDVELSAVQFLRFLFFRLFFFSLYPFSDRCLHARKKKAALQITRAEREKRLQMTNNKSTQEKHFWGLCTRFYLLLIIS